MEPKPVKAMEDPGAMAAFIEDMSDKTNKLQDAEQSSAQLDQSSAGADSTLVSTSNEAQEGADFAAKFALEIDEQQKEKESSGSSPKSWYENQ